MKKIIFNNFSEPFLEAETMNQMQDNIEEAINESGGTSGSGIHIGPDEPTDTDVWIDTDEPMTAIGTEVVDTLSGNETNKSPSVRAVKEGLLDEYSTEETIIGTWIDGKPIYRKVFSGTTPSSGDSLNLCDSSNMVLINYGGSIKGSIYGFVIGKSNVGSTNNGLRILNNNGTLTMQYGSQYLGYSYELFVEYTKTTD